MNDVKIQTTRSVPGAVIYGLLALQELGWCRSVSEPTVTAILNVFMRAPMIVPAQLWLWVAFLEGSADAATWAVVAQLVLAPLNVVYYSWESVRRAGRKKKRG